MNNKLFDDELTISWKTCSAQDDISREEQTLWSVATIAPPQSLPYAIKRRLSSARRAVPIRFLIPAFCAVTTVLLIFLARDPKPITDQEFVLYLEESLEADETTVFNDNFPLEGDVIFTEEHI